ncbi:MAG: substrate-binding domain-containing protein [Thermoplasmata archaeon]|nr:substrate-binding domain-containing protein [Thermoplasmata archaeon]
MGDLPAPTSPGPSSVATDGFAAEAERTGLVLPKPKRTNPWLAAGLVLLLVGASLGVGYATGWLNPHRSAPLRPVLLGPQDCTVTNVPILGAYSPDSADVLASSWQRLGSAFTNYTGGCVNVTFHTSGGAEGVGAQAAGGAEYTLSAVPPDPGALAALGGPVKVSPALLTAVGVVYNLPSLAEPLRLSGAALAGIFLGSITRWNDPAIQAANPGQTLPGSAPISVAHRNDSTVLTSLLTTYLAHANATWNQTVGTGSTVPWPVGYGADSNAALLAWVGGAVGSIGYAPVGSPGTVGMSVAELQNAAGGFAAPNASGVDAAGSAVAGTSAATNGGWGPDSFVGAPGLASYPLVLPSYAVLYTDLGTAYGTNLSLHAAQWLLTFLWWAGAQVPPDSGASALAAMPPSLLLLLQGTIEKILYHGNPALSESESGREGGGETGIF